jgi:glycosyltransferase involved in cell wall biosynthesis
MAAAAMKLLEDDSMRRQFGEAGRRWAVERFDEASVVRQYRRIYRRVLED